MSDLAGKIRHRRINWRHTGQAVTADFEVCWLRWDVIRKYIIDLCISNGTTRNLSLVFLKKDRNSDCWERI